MENIIITGIIILIYGICKGIKDKISFHYGSGWTKNLNPLYWNPILSWKNKYKNGKVSEGPKFLGSTTIFVSFTDAWHLFDMIQTISIISLMTLYLEVWWYFPILWVIKTVGFKIFYK